VTSWFDLFRLKESIDGHKFREADPGLIHKPSSPMNRVLQAAKSRQCGEAAPKDVDYDKWADCVHDVAAKGGDYNQYAVCGASLQGMTQRHAARQKQAGQPAKGPPKHGGYGIDKEAKGNYWMGAAITQAKGRTHASPRKGKSTPESGDAPAATNSPDDIQDELNKLCNDNPNMSAATFLNTLQAKGYQVIKATPDANNKSKQGKKKKEADSSSVNTQALRSKESDKSIQFNTCKFKESSTGGGGPDGSKFSATLLMEGLGNLVDGFYYTKDALMSGVTLFEGKKIYADHPGEDDEVNRPERSVRDILGHFENCQVETLDDGRQALTADVVILPGSDYDWARTQMSHAIKYSEKFPDKEFIGLSINASGDSAEVPLDEFMNETDVPETCIPKLMKAKEQGLENLKLAMKFKNAVSIDLVTTPGAGGKILQFLEQEK
jgi:hypothetical protein